MSPNKGNSIKNLWTYFSPICFVSVHCQFRSKSFINPFIYIVTVMNEEMILIKQTFA